MLTIIARGALAKIGTCSTPTDVTAQREWVTASGGNHGLGVCYAAKIHGGKAHVFVGAHVPQYKRDALESAGGVVHVYGKDWQESSEGAQKYADENGIEYVHPFDDDTVHLGQATIALEIVEQMKERGENRIDAFVCSIGGGGLISGVAKYFKTHDPSIKVFGVETSGANSMQKSVEAGKLVELEKVDTIAEGLATRMVCERTLQVVRENVDELVTVTDQEAMHALREVLVKDRQFVEPSASCSVAALDKLLKGKVDANSNVVVLLCGGNFALERLNLYA